MSQVPSQLNGIAIVDVCGHEVPLPAYWRILELWDEGMSDGDIVKQVCRFTGPDKIKSVKQVVLHVVDNQRRMKNVPKGLKRNSVLPTRTKKISEYRASRLQARADLEHARERLESAKELERQLLSQTLALSKERERIYRGGHDSERAARLKREIEEVLQSHRAAEAEVEYWDTLKKLHRASLA